MYIGKYRILIYSDHFFPSIGGSENYALDLATELTNQSNVVGVITPEKAFSKDEFSFQTFRLKRRFSPHGVGLNFLEIPRIIKQFQPDIFHINYQTGGENLLIPILKIMKIPIVLTYHADHCLILGKMIDELQLISTFRCASSLLVQSERDKRKFRNRGIPDKKLNLLNFSGIDTNKYKCYYKNALSENSIKLLCIARLDDSHKYKGIKELINGMKKIEGRKISFSLSLDIIGDGNLRNIYENECRSLQLNNVNFFGNLSLEDMIRMICNANFLILPSVDKAEGFGRVALEAISCGIPVIVSKYAGIAELIRKYDAGIIYDPKDYESLVNVLTALLSEPTKVHQLNINANRLLYMEGLVLSDTTKKVTKIYQSLKKV